MKYNKEESWLEYESIMADKPRVEFKSEDVGKEVVKIIKRLPVNEQSLDLLKYIKKKYE